MSVRNSADEFISIHALGRERLLVLFYALPSYPLETLICARSLGDERVFVSVFYTPVAKRSLNRSLISAATNHRP